ncbi:hypothetical protein FMN63_28725 [Stappia sp. BW2]|nr:hypothetical protein FMN63_28725 [Stappia sp. BW2]
MHQHHFRHLLLTDEVNGQGMHALRSGSVFSHLAATDLEDKWRQMSWIK